MQFVLPYVKTTTPLHASNLPEKNTINSDDKAETGGEPSLEEDREAASTEASDYQPNNPFFQTEQCNSDVTERNLPSAEVPQSKNSSIPPTKISKRKRPLDEVDRTFVNFMKERQRQVGESENTRKMFLLSLLDEITNMSDQQWKLFKRRTLNVIDEIMTPSRTYINQFEDSLRTSSDLSRESMVTMASPPYSDSSQLSFPSNNNQTDSYSRDRQIAIDSSLQNTSIGQDFFPL